MSKIIEKEQCQICVFDRVKRSMITCPKCNLVCCQGCVKKFLLDSSLQTPTCMGCKVGWDLEFVLSNTDSSFEEQYRVHRAKISLSLEKSLIPDTQVDALRESKQRDHLRFLRESNANIKKIKGWLKLAEVKKEKYLIKSTRLKIVDKDMEKSKKYIDKYDAISAKIRECKLTIGKISDTISQEMSQYHQQNNIVLLEEKKVVKAKPSYICPCPQDECKGFIDSVTYKCGICEKEVCKKCQVPVHDDNCDKDILETVKMLKKETKPCPKCQVPIFKIDGCDQIWCTSCHTAFSWNTGEIETGKIHNPHYYQWMRENGGLPREQGDIRGGPCEQQVNMVGLIRNVSRFLGGREALDYLTQCHRLVFHIRQVMIGNIDNEDDRLVNKHMRIRYMLGDFNEKQWLSKIKAREKSKDIRKFETLLFTMCANTLEDLLNNISICETLEQFLNYSEQFHCLNRYVSDSILRAKKRFKVKMPWFDTNWNLTYV